MRSIRVIVSIALRCRIPNSKATGRSGFARLAPTDAGKPQFVPIQRQPTRTHPSEWRGRPDAAPRSWKRRRMTRAPRHGRDIPSGRQHRALCCWASSCHFPGGAKIVGLQADSSRNFPTVRHDRGTSATATGHAFGWNAPHKETDGDDRIRFTNPREAQEIIAEFHMMILPKAKAGSAHDLSTPAIVSCLVRQRHREGCGCGSGGNYPTSRPK